MCVCVCVTTIKEAEAKHGKGWRKERKGKNTVTVF